MDQIVEKALLFDFYGELLTEHQKDVYSEHIQNDLSATEIAELRGISRQGAHDLIRRCEKILYDYEQRLHLVEHFVKIRAMVNQIHSYADGIVECDDLEKIQQNVREIADISNNILEEF